MKAPSRMETLPAEELRRLVSVLLEENQALREQVQALRDEVARLKGDKPRPNIPPPSPLEKDPEKEKWTPESGKPRPGSAKRGKRAELKIHETRELHPAKIPEGSVFKGWEEYVVQELVIEPHNTLYRLARYEIPGGGSVRAELPPGVEGKHFGPMVRAFVLQQHYGAGVTQPLILEELREFGLDISAGQVNRIIVEGHETLHEEKEQMLSRALEVSDYIHVDDTGARHAGRNGVCTLIGNDLFAWFQSTESKSRINFLELLCAGRVKYVLNGPALEYMAEQGLPREPLELLMRGRGELWESGVQWALHLRSLGITEERHVRLATEGALLGALEEGGVNPDLAVMSDDAGQFNVLAHFLCWIHAERTIHKLVPMGEAQAAALEASRTRVWDFYRDLKEYKAAPEAAKAAELEARFDAIFSEKTCFQSLNLALKRLRANKAELLLVLSRPDLPLHNNGAERDIREYVKKRKISGGTRSELGRRCLDTFLSLKKTARKLGISFWRLLLDRLQGCREIPCLTELIAERARAMSGLT